MTNILSTKQLFCTREDIWGQWPIEIGQGQPPPTFSWKIFEKKIFCTVLDFKKTFLVLFSFQGRGITECMSNNFNDALIDCDFEVMDEIKYHDLVQQNTVIHLHS
jgi:hypothetical protein